MVPLSHLLAFMVAAFVLIIVPGPSVLFTVSRALTVGRRDALLTVVGNAAGVYVQVVAVAFGVGTVIERSQLAYAGIKLVGAGYLVYLGVAAIRHRHGLVDALRVTAVPRGAVRVLGDGLVVGVGNPKPAVFFAATLPQFVNPAVGALSAQMLVLGAVFIGIGLVSDSGWALVASSARDWLARTPRRLELIGGVGGLTMIGLGVTLAITGRKD